MIYNISLVVLFFQHFYFLKFIDSFNINIGKSTPHPAIDLRRHFLCKIFMIVSLLYLLQQFAKMCPNYIFFVFIIHFKTIWNLLFMSCISIGSGLAFISSNMNSTFYLSVPFLGLQFTYMLELHTISSIIHTHTHTHTHHFLKCLFSLSVSCWIFAASGFSEVVDMLSGMYRANFS
jgi:hypothetical protein